MQRRLWRVCTFAQAHLSLRPGTEISCAGSNNDLFTVYKNSECCGEAAPATTGILKTFTKKKTQSSNRFLDVISWEYDNCCA